MPSFRLLPTIDNNKVKRSERDRYKESLSLSPKRVSVRRKSETTTAHVFTHRSAAIRFYSYGGAHRRPFFSAVFFNYGEVSLSSSSPPLQLLS